MRNGRRSAADSRSDQAPQHQTRIFFHGERDKTGNNRRYNTQVADSRAYFRECVINPRIPLKTLFPGLKHILHSTLGVPNVGTFTVEHRRALFGENG